MVRFNSVHVLLCARKTVEATFDGLQMQRPSLEVVFREQLLFCGVGTQFGK
jgi:hypothetical protein